MEKRKNQRRRRILAELKGWCEKELGDGYSVEVANSKNAARMILLWLLLKITKATLSVLLPGLSIQVGLSKKCVSLTWTLRILPNSTAKSGINLNMQRGYHNFLQK